MKLFELTVDKRGIHFRREIQEPMTEEHKFYIVMALLGLTAFLGFFGLMTIAR